VGAISIDRLLLATNRSLTRPGGAGLYTALALAASGVETALFAPLPDPVPELLQSVTAGLLQLGPRVAPGELARLEIAHHGDGRATLVAADWGAVARLEPEQLPELAAHVDTLHVAALPTPAQQRRFVRWARARGLGRVSSGTFARAVESDRNGVLGLLSECDFFFMNENEARLLLGALETAPRPARGAIFVTRGRHGARILEPGRTSDVPALATDELDPTGAGDSFCGAALAALAGGADPVEAARAGCRLAAAVVAAAGPSALLRGG
jgi:sugar/nucleoside kinase (ribokinase family)